MLQSAALSHTPRILQSLICVPDATLQPAELARLHRVPRVEVDGVADPDISFQQERVAIEAALAADPRQANPVRAAIEAALAAKPQQAAPKRAATDAGLVAGLRRAALKPASTMSPASPPSDLSQAIPMWLQQALAQLLAQGPVQAEALGNAPLCLLDDCRWDPCRCCQRLPKNRSAPHGNCVLGPTYRIQ